MEKNIKIRYLRDPQNFDRVLTLMTRHDRGSNTIEYAYSINRPSEWIMVTETPDVRVMHRVKGDSFNKKRARSITEARLAKRAVSVQLHGRTPLRAVLETLVESEDSTVRRIAQAEADYLSVMDSLKAINSLLGDNQDTHEEVIAETEESLPHDKDLN